MQNQDSILLRNSSLTVYYHFHSHGAALGHISYQIHVLYIRLKDIMLVIVLMHMDEASIHLQNTHILDDIQVIKP